jgi:hypothetical protein
MEPELSRDVHRSEQTEGYRPKLHYATKFPRTQKRTIAFKVRRKSGDFERILKITRGDRSF